MARTARVVIPHLAHHVVHRAWPGRRLFVGDEDYSFYTSCLLEGRGQFGCEVYAYCLMLDHVHLLVNPGSDRTRLARFLAHLARTFAAHVRRTRPQDLPLWHGRFRSSPVADAALLPCARHIELNPVRACLTRRAADYRWSSATAKLGRCVRTVDFDEHYLALGATREECAQRYAGYLLTPVSLEESTAIRDAVRRADLTGDGTFKAMLVARYGVSLRRKRGRPRRVAATEPSPIAACIAGSMKASNHCQGQPG